MRLATVASVGRDAQGDVVVSVDGQTWHRIASEGERSWAKSLKGIITFCGKRDLNRLAPSDLPVEKDAADSNSLQFLAPLRHIEKLICIGKTTSCPLPIRHEGNLLKTTGISGGLPPISAA